MWMHRDDAPDDPMPREQGFDVTCRARWRSADKSGWGVHLGFNGTKSI